MNLRLPNNSTHEDVEKAYYRVLSRLTNYNLSAMARVAHKGRAAIRSRFTKWGWEKKLVETKTEPPAPATPAAAEIAEARMNDYLKSRKRGR